MSLGGCGLSPEANRAASAPLRQREAVRAVAADGGAEVVGHPSASGDGALAGERDSARWGSIVPDTAGREAFAEGAQAGVRASDGRSRSRSEMPPRDVMDLDERAAA